MSMSPSLQSDLDASQAGHLDLTKLIRIDERIAMSGDIETVLDKFQQEHSNKYCLMWTGLMHWFKGNYRDAWIDLSEAAEALPNEIRIPWYRAILIRDDSKPLYWKRYELARHWVNQVIARYPEFEPALDYKLYLSGYYSQLGQDTMTEDFFSYNPVSSPIFVDAGAFDGISSSNTHRLFKIGWHGVCIEPIMGNYEKLRALYANTSIHCIRCAVSTKPGREQMMVADTGSALLTDGRKALAGHQVEDVHLFSLNQILEELKINKVDLLSIDCEGVDFDVLQSISLERYRPKLIVIEHNSESQAMSAIDQYLRRYGYIFWHNNKQDLFYRAHDTRPAPNFWEIKTLLPKRQLADQHAQTSPRRETWKTNPSQQIFDISELQLFELEERIALEPENLMLYSLAARLLLQGRDLIKAADKLRDALKVNNDSQMIKQQLDYIDQLIVNEEKEASKS